MRNFFLFSNLYMIILAYKTRIIQDKEGHTLTHP
jgi:hypothetical protein